MVIKYIKKRLKCLLQAVVLKKSIYMFVVYMEDQVFLSRRMFSPTPGCMANGMGDDEENFLFSFLLYSNIKEGGNNSIRFLRNSLRWKQLNFSLIIRISLCWNIFTLVVDAVRRLMVLLLLLLAVATDGSNIGLEKMQLTDVVICCCCCAM